MQFGKCRCLNHISAIFINVKEGQLHHNIYLINLWISHTYIWSYDTFSRPKSWVNFEYLLKRATQAINLKLSMHIYWLKKFIVFYRFPSVLSQLFAPKKKFVFSILKNFEKENGGRSTLLMQGVKCRAFLRDVVPRSSKWYVINLPKKTSVLSEIYYNSLKLDSNVKFSQSGKHMNKGIRFFFLDCKLCSQCVKIEFVYLDLGYS